MLCKCIGGPMDGHSLFLESPSTAVFTLYGDRGFYEQRWEHANAFLYWQPC